METKNNTNANKSRKAIRIVISILVAIALWVDVNKKYAFSLLCNAGSKINGGCCFADAAFLICDGYEFCHYEPPHMLF